MIHHAHDVIMTSMIGALALILVVIWIFGVATSRTLDGQIHLLLALALVLISINVLTDGTPLR